MQRLNVGGQIFVTSSWTLNKRVCSFNKQLLEGLELGFDYDENGYIIIDRNPKYFGYILDYLRMVETKQDFYIPDNVDRNEFLNEVKYFELEGLLNMFPYMDSVILDENGKRDLCKLCGFAKDQKFKLLYRGSRDGLSTKIFHEKCDNILNTVTLIKSSSEYIFGGYVEQAWDQSEREKSNPNAFLFSLVNYRNLPIKMPFGSLNAQSKWCSQFCSSSMGPCFGRQDLCICFGKSNTSYLMIYNHPWNNIESFDKTTFLAGSRQFDLKEIEVFSI